MTSSFFKGQHTLVLYHYVDDIMERRDPFRTAHLEHWTSYLSRGLAGAGPCLDPVDIGVYIFHSQDKPMIEEAIANDPYVQAGLVKSHEIRAYMVAVGKEPETQ
jgi:uncharacterized protein YciI